MAALTATTLVLTSGSHDRRGPSLCAMEAVAWLAGEPRSDAPACACPILAAFARRLNDARWPTDEDRTDAFRALAIGYPATETAPAVPALLIGTRSTPAVERARRAYLVDCALRWYAPLAIWRAVAACEARGVDCTALRAATLRLCEEPTRDHARDARDHVRKVRAAADDASAYAAAYDATAYDATAAYDAAYAATSAAAADDATYAAATAAYAAATAAYAAATAAADALLVILRLAADHLRTACAITEAA